MGECAGKLLGEPVLNMDVLCVMVSSRVQGGRMTRIKEVGKGAEKSLTEA